MSNYNSYPGIGVDSKILITQNVLSSKLGFSNVDFYGRVQKVISKDLKSFTPEFYAEWPKRKEVYYDSKKAPGGNVFFIVSDEDTTKDGVLFEAKVKVVFMLNLEKLISGKTYWPDAEIQETCLKLLKRIGTIDPTGIERGIENVFKGFDITNIRLNGIQPYHTFSINGILKYTFNCNH
ncbi:hypothetical protein [Flavobacterium sp. 102]|uniref:hypothetical protein n=1 Tax=Flavobacterium sp. 102 TaxID=2135623 RepID=UPI000EB5884E|nr:hypothetical protein [Flavobacterium sp. 102]RKS00418.1 hypothetical protein C8C84_0026 [Flavobacterium sp. 102]